MADIRINALATTAASTASDDFVAVDGSANGTRKLNAFSPTFGGNLTVSGTAAISGYVTSVEGFVTTATSANTTQSRLYLDSPAGQTGAVARILKGGSDLFSLSAAGTATLSGNLTVSGTGTSSFAGKIQTTSANGIEAIVGSGNTGLSLQSGSTQYSLYLNAADNSYRLYSSLGGDRFAVSSGGNFLLATTTDSGNGRIQLATHTTSAGGIGFGTDTSLFRVNNGRVAVNGTSAGVLYFYEGGAEKGYIGTAAGDLYVGASTAKSILLQTNGTTALTLDSSQNATFAKNVTIGSGVAGSTLTIGASTSSATVNVVAATDNTARINLDETAATNGAFWQYVGSTNTIQIGSRVSSTDTVAISFARASANVTVAGNLNVTGTQNILGLPATADALGSNSTMTFELTSNTSLTIKVRGTDGTTRSVALTLA